MNAFIRVKHEAVREAFDAITQNLEDMIEEWDEERAEYPEHTDATEVLIANSQMLGDVISEFLLEHGWGVSTGICEEFTKSYSYFWKCAARLEPHPNLDTLPVEDEDAYKAIEHFRAAVAKFRVAYPEDEYTRECRAKAFASIGHDALDEKRENEAT